MLALLFVSQAARADLITFDELVPPPDTHFFDGSTVTNPGESGTFSSNGGTFHYDVNFNDFGPPFGTGFGYSNNNLATYGKFTNAYTAVTLAGRGTTSRNPGVYGVSNGYLDPVSNGFQQFDFDPFQTPELLELLPHFDLPSGKGIVEAYLTNTTYGYGIMRDGDGFAGSPLGGFDGTEIDYVKVIAYGIDSVDGLKSAEFLLADWGFTDANTHYILNDWAKFDLRGLGDSSRIYFNVTSTKTGEFGLNVPGFFAIDDIRFDDLSAVPEPTSIVLLLTGGIGLACMRRKQKPTAAA